MERSWEALAGQVLIAGFPAPEPPEELERAVRDGALGGVILFKRNITAPETLAPRLGRLAALAPKDTPLLIAVDQEGGRVARLGAPVVKLPPMRRLAALDDVVLTARAGALLGRQLRALGFTMDYAPILDVDTNPDNPVIGDRSFGRTADEVIRHALAFASGLESAGVLTCGKHFPGHGDTNVDSHLALPRVRHDRARLDAVELAPFRAARAKVSALMTAHVVFDALDPDVPATLSRTIVSGVLRDELGYDGVVVSDDLEMKAIADHHGAPDAAKQALRAGCDQLLVCSRVDWLFEVRAALALEAERDEAFAARLRDAVERGLAMRRRAPGASADPAGLEAALAREETAAFEAELAARLEAVA